VAAQQHLIQAYQCALALDPDQAPPPQLVMAWHTASDDVIPVAVEADGVQWLLLVDGTPRVPNPVKEFEDWQRIRDVCTRVDRRVAELQEQEQMEGE
jgi:hypothetical protein